MKVSILLILAVLCLNFRALSQSPLLETKVSIQNEEITIENAIDELHDKYGINFSYVNNLIPLKKKVKLNVSEQSLKATLDELFKDVDVNYYVIGDKIVLKNEPKKTSSLIEKPGYISSISDLRRETELRHEENDANLFVFDSTNIRPDSPQPIQAEFSDRVIGGLIQVKDQVVQELGTLNKKSVGLLKKDSKTDSTQVTVDSIKAEATKTIVVGDSSLVAEKDSLPTEENGYIKRPVQISFASPLGTNGMQAGNTVNIVSLNILTGYAAGLEGAEFAGILNIEKDYVKGAQFAGFANLVKKNVTGAQFAGFLNMAGSTNEAAQFAGFANIVNSSVTGAQFAGFTNIAKGMKGPQAAGFANIVGGDVKGFQAAGFANINKGQMVGPQFAGFINVVGGDSKAAQFAGFANINRGDVTGAQVSGFLNFARKVKGVQLGFINLADSVEGAQIGFLSFARKGYRRLEIWGSEALYANMAFKMGSRSFHNIFAVGGQTSSADYFRWGWGYGFGSEIGLSQGLALNIDAIAYHINEDEIFTDELNLLNQLRATFGFRLGGRTHLFVGPTFNVMVSNYSSGDSDKIGSGIVPWHTYNKNHGDTNVTMWPGFNAGIRF